MVFYGTKSSNIKDGQLRNVTCPHCENNVTMTYSVFGKYAHIYWIPFFPISKEQILECNSCKASYYLKDLPETIKQKFCQDLERNPIKTPIKHFSGLFLAAIGIAIGTFFSFKSDSETKEFAKNPKVGDVFYEKTLKSGWFSTAKLIKVTKDSIYCLENNMQTDQKSSVDKIATSDVNYTLPWSMTKKQYLDYVNKNDTIYEIKRK